MDRRYIIYDGFESDVSVIFKDLIDRFDFIIKSKSDSGIVLENSKIILDLSFENVPIVWITNKLKNEDMLLNLIINKSKRHLKNELKLILGTNFYKNRKGSLMKLTNFLTEHFSTELMPLQ